jgi:hypothetical protein
MTCHHDPGDPNCSATVGGHAWQDLARRESLARERQFKGREAELLARTPNPEEFDVVEVEEVGPHLVMMVQYSSCPKCTFDSKKVMVYLDTTTKDAIRWRTVDPHFAPDLYHDPRVAPPPRARFPADDEGWQDALAFARSKTP